MPNASAHSFASPYRWYHELKGLFILSLERCRAGERDPARHYTPEQTAYLASIGLTAQELFDFADDHTRYDGDPDWETTLLTNAIRREYFLTVQQGQASGNLVAMDKLPSKGEKLDGIPWLPRLIKKAEAKLRGEMPPELMYGCAGDRRFFRERGLSQSDFLRLVWVTGGDATRILAYAKTGQLPPL